MNIKCEDRDRVFEDGSPAEWAALEAHSATCAACAEELDAWKALSVAAKELRDYSDSPSLWPRIERSLTEEAAAKKARAGRWGWLSLGFGFSLGWQTAAAGALVLLLTVSAGWIYLHRPTPMTPADQSLLKSSALAEVERSQAAYEQAIDKLAADAKPALENPASPLQSSYREKLLVLDSAINDLRAQAGMNPSNAHLRQQLLAMYQEKQQTLKDILEEKR
jgi:anti-sigma factor RsiW